MAQTGGRACLPPISLQRGPAPMTQLGTGSALLQASGGKPCHKDDADVFTVIGSESLSRVRLCNPIDCGPPGSSVQGILQARMLEWAAMPSSRGMFPTQGLNPHLLHCRQILYHLDLSSCEFVISIRTLSPRLRSSLVHQEEDVQRPACCV